MRRSWFRYCGANLTWFVRDLVWRWQLDTPTGLAGIITGISGFGCLVILGQGFARMFQAFFPWVSGSRVGEVYWGSVGWGFRISFMFLVFCISLIVFLVLRLTDRR